MIAQRSDPSVLTGPIPVKLPFGMLLQALPFKEPLLIKVAAAYEAATHLRMPPAEFPALPGEP